VAHDLAMTKEAHDHGARRADDSDRPPGRGRPSLADLSWSEQTVTWNTAPATDAVPVASLDRVSKNLCYEVDVKQLVTGDGPVGLAITSSASDGAADSSREGPVSQRPELVVECGSQ
jgi:hypothetical protein